MLFNSLDFLLFLPFVIVSFYILPHRFRWMLLLAASYFFYAGWKWEYIWLILFSSGVDFIVAQRIHESQDPFRRKLLLAISLIVNFGLLISFKYFHFLFGSVKSIDAAVASSDAAAHIVYYLEFGIPLGISFYTFQTVSYTVDVYRRRTEPARDFLKFSLYISYFPQLVAGPIEHYQDLNPQLFRKTNFSFENIRAGLQLMLYGFFIKMVIADNLGSIAAPVFDQPGNYDILSRFTAVGFFTLQIYSDFFGYSLIALGLARMMDVRLMDNFRSPYFAYSLRDFWNKWHITLSRWFMDYVYKPLGGSRRGKVRWLFSILAVLLLSGLWHGASANFLWWGLIHGAFYLIEQTFFPVREEPGVIEKILRWLLTISVVMFGWIFFRAPTMKLATAFFESGGQEKLDLSGLLWLIPVLALFILSEIFFRGRQVERAINLWPNAIRWSWYGLLIISLLLFSGTGSMQFIYFQF